jgi:acetyltransferase-like isoleucine patch superfamily enzyme
MRTGPFVHPTAIIEDEVVIGGGSSVWDHAHLRRGALIGEDCIVGGKSYLANGVRVGDRCKINGMVFLCAGVSLGDGVFVAAHTTFTNDFYPRACTNDLTALRPSDIDEHTTFTTVQDGVSIGAAATIGSDLVLGRFAVIGMGAVVTRSVPAYTLVLGAPARPVALVCRCGRPLVTLLDGAPPDGEYRCGPCGVGYGVRGGAVVHDPLGAGPPIPVQRGPGHPTPLEVAETGGTAQLAG